MCKRCDANLVPTARNWYKHTNQCLDFGRFVYWLPAKLEITTCQFESPWLLSLVAFFKHYLRHLYVYTYVYIYIYRYINTAYRRIFKWAEFPQNLQRPSSVLAPRGSPWPPRGTWTAQRRSSSRSSSRVERCTWSSTCRWDGMRILQYSGFLKWGYPQNTHF